MIKENELRIGNYINSPYGGASEITEIGYEECGYYIRPRGSHSGYYIDSHCSPIPLTDRWLIKLGFNYDTCTRWFGIDTEDSYFHLRKKRGGYVFIFCLDGVYREKIFKSVHELQNFFYALYGEELTIKQD
jgi:hypothetical protein